MTDGLLGRWRWPHWRVRTGLSPVAGLSKSALTCDHSHRARIITSRQPGAGMIAEAIFPLRDRVEQGSGDREPTAASFVL